MSFLCEDIGRFSYLHQCTFNILHPQQLCLLELYYSVQKDKKIITRNVGQFLRFTVKEFSKQCPPIPDEHLGSCQTCLMELFFPEKLTVKPFTIFKKPHRRCLTRSVIISFTTIIFNVNIFLEIFEILEVFVRGPMLRIYFRKVLKNFKNQERGSNHTYFTFP